MNDFENKRKIKKKKETHSNNSLAWSHHITSRPMSCHTGHVASYHSHLILLQLYSICQNKHMGTDRSPTITMQTEAHL